MDLINQPPSEIKVGTDHIMSIESCDTFTAHTYTEDKEKKDLYHYVAA